MWRHALVAASFDHAWATTNPVTLQTVTALPALLDIDGAAQAAVTLRAAFVNVAQSGACISGVGSATEVPEVGISGTLNVTVADGGAFYTDATSKKDMLEEWLSDQLSTLPQSSVVVTIPPAPTTTIAPATQAPADAGATSASGTATGGSSGPVTVPASGDPVSAVIPTTFVVTLPPGKAEIASRLSSTTPADLLAGFNSQLPVGTVTSASVTMNAATAEGAGGTFLLAAADTSATGIQSVVNQGHIRTAIASLAGVYIGDVSPITITTANPAAPIAPEPDASDTVGASTSSRRLTAGSVNAAFNIQVPGHRALGWQKDCSLQKVVSGALPPALASTDANPFRSLQNAAGASQNINTPAACATEALRRNVGDVWSWEQTAHECTISDQALLSDYTFQAQAVTQYNTASDACGDCPSVLPAGGVWPGADAASSHSAFGVNAHQPLNLQCWPKNANFDLMPCGHQVLETYDATVAGGWPGRCNNLVQDNVAQTEAACQENCENNVFCTVWQWATNTGDTVPVCYSGSGNSCWTPAAGRTAIGSVTASQRIQHGRVNIIVDGGVLTSNVLTGLQQQFGENVGTVSTVLSTWQAQMAACRNICHSNVMCSYWQSFYNLGAGTDLGCWIENPGVDATGNGNVLGNLVAYPLTQAGYDTSTTATANQQYLKGGQFIQHHCEIPTLPARAAATTTTTTTVAPFQAPALVPTVAPPSGGFMNPWGYLLIILALLAALALVAFMMLQPKPKPTNKRAVKPIKAKEAPPPPPVPQPVVPLMAQQILVQPTIPQPLAMTTIQQPMTTIPAQAVAQPMMQAQPMATYAGAPQFVQRPY